ncbi:hypothetical protein TorRG33x02_042940 [Trema orientale]|uniref:Uncharacterized protein n=1 Tax=Trema orientale TaxID=63057 RepID=A0A2P5FQ29_TREOI|nr:hypothetical protein TorRG33x02_042940 [Trema orientale]
MYIPNSVTLPLPDTQKTPEGLRARTFIVLTAFFITLITLLRQLTCRVTGKLPNRMHTTVTKVFLSVLLMRQTRKVIALTIVRSRRYRESLRR